MCDQHSQDVRVKLNKAVGVLPDVVDNAVQPRLSLHQDEHLGHREIVEGTGNPKIVREGV